MEQGQKRLSELKKENAFKEADNEHDEEMQVLKVKNELKDIFERCDEDIRTKFDSLKRE